MAREGTRGSRIIIAFTCSSYVSSIWYSKVASSSHTGYLCNSVCIYAFLGQLVDTHAKSVIDWPASSDESSLTSLFVAFARTKSRDIVSNRVCAIQFHSTGPSYRGRSGSGRLERKFFFRNFILSLQFLYWSIRC